MHPALTRSFRINYFDVIFIVIYWLSITCIYLIDYKGVIVVLWATPKEAMSLENRLSKRNRIGVLRAGDTPNTLHCDQRVESGAARGQGCNKNKNRFGS